MYIILRPLGGFNDILCTIHRAYLYSIIYNRTLIIHTANQIDHCLLADGIENYFETSVDNILLGMPLNPDLSNCMADLIDYSSHPFPWKKPATNSYNRRKITSLDRGYSEGILIYEACGGGYVGKNAFSYLTLNNEMKIFIRNFHKDLPSEFNAIHCRHSDYRSNLDMLFQQLNELSSDEIPIYFATDNKDILRKILLMNFGVPILNFCTTHNDSNQPIHLSKLASSRLVIKELLAELSVLTLAKQFVSPLLTNPTDPNIPKSGFSILAEQLRLNTNKEGLRSYFTSGDPASEPKPSEESMNAEIQSVALDPKSCFSPKVNLCISIPTYRRITEFERLLQQISAEVSSLPRDMQTCLMIRILENPSEFTDRKHAILDAIDLGHASKSFASHSHNIGGEANVAIAYNHSGDNGYNWVIGDDEQIIEGVLPLILQYLSNNKECGLLLLHDPSNPPCEAVLDKNLWSNYQEFARWISQVEPFQLISHSLISLNIVKNGIYEYDVAKFECDVIAKRAGLIGTYSHLIAIVTGLCKNDSLQVHVLPNGAVDYSNRAPHEEIAFTWSDVRWLWKHYLYWLCYFLGLDYEFISAHQSMDIVHGRDRID